MPTLNQFRPSNVFKTGCSGARVHGCNQSVVGGFMSFLNRLLGKSEPPKQRVQVCVECGMPVADHKQWCSILRGQIEIKRESQEIKS